MDVGPDGLRGTPDDTEQPLSQFSREIWICDHSNSLREIQVTVDFRVGNLTRQYRLTTYISNYSWSEDARCDRQQIGAARHSSSSSSTWAS